MGNRPNIQELLESMLSSKNVYMQPPSQMEYPAIKYRKKKPKTFYAGNKKYLMRDCFELIVIARLPNNPVIKKLLELPNCEWDRWYAADGLNHDVLTLYY